jgi:hypothetical protein
MNLNLSLPFPSEAEQLRQRGAAERRLTATQRLLALADALAAAETLSCSGTQRAAQLAYHERCEEEWRQRILQFIVEHRHAADRVAG